jgi:hypothetical protein
MVAQIVGVLPRGALDFSQSNLAGGYGEDEKAALVRATPAASIVAAHFASITGFIDSPASLQPQLSFMD